MVFFIIFLTFLIKHLTEGIYFRIISKYQNPSFDICPLGQSVKTSPFHGGVMGSTPIEGTKHNLGEPI